jgi:NAD(P)-dependent dehydrogenase (short-subunit alcohol dehydrogenase family)
VEAGAKVLGVDYVESTQTKDELGDNFEFVVANLLTTEPIELIIETAKQKFGRIDILVNNAGIIKRNDAIDFTEQEWDDVLNINLKTLFFLSWFRQYRVQVFSVFLSAESLFLKKLRELLIRFLKTESRINITDLYPFAKTSR